MLAGNCSPKISVRTTNHGASPYRAKLTPPVEEFNLCSENLEFGIGITVIRLRPNVSSNVCQRNENGGIFIYGRHLALIRENQCMDSDVGIARR